MSRVDQRARDNDRSRGWWDQHLARGLCAICRRALPDDATRAWHPDCLRAARRLSYAEIRGMSAEAIARVARGGTPVNP